MEDFKEKIKYYLELYKKEIIIGIVIFIFLLLSILIYYFYSINFSKEKVFEETSVEEIIVEENEKEEIILADQEIVNENVEDTVKKVVVDIKGEVKNPGVYEIDENKRINDVIKLAGGLTKNASTLVNNLSRKVEDEMVIIIYSKNDIEEFKTKKEEEKEILDNFKEIEESIPNDSVIENDNIDSNTNVDNNKENIEEDAIVSDDIKISINTATKEELMTIDGVGESKANAIITYREENGNFLNLEDIMNVSGIGEKMFEKIKDKITL